MTNPPTPEDSKTFALQAYDRVVIVADLIMEHWLEGNVNPPKELIDAYYDAVDEATFFINGTSRLHERSLARTPTSTRRSTQSLG